MLSNKREASLAGERYYYTGLMCKNGHTDKRFTHNGACYSCVAKSGVTWHAKIKNDPVRRKEQIVQRIKQRAIRDGIDFDIEVADVEWVSHCPVFGYELSYHEPDKDRSVSIDKIDPNKGYVKGNVQVMSLRANRAKWNLTKDEVRKLYEYLCA